jgi:hypothetical protein
MAGDSLTGIVLYLCAKEGSFGCWFSCECGVVLLVFGRGPRRCGNSGTEAHNFELNAVGVSEQNTTTAYGTGWSLS